MKGIPSENQRDRPLDALTWAESGTFAARVLQERKE